MRTLSKWTQWGIGMRTFLYARVSTLDETIELQATQARQMGFEIDEVISDEGVSGVSTKLADRPGGARLLDKVRRGDQVVVRWVDRLGRNYEDVTATIRELMRQGVVVRTVINGMTFDGATTDPMQQAVRDALIGFMAATAQAQAEVTKIAQRAGIDHAKEQGGAYLGRRPGYDRDTFNRVVDMLGQGQPIAAIAVAAGVKRQTVYRIRDNRAEAEAALARWGV